MSDAETFFTALAHPVRRRTVMLLAREGELCVCELTHALGLAQPTISWHLAHLRDSGLVSDRREGLWIHYRLHPQLALWAKRVIKHTLAGIGGRDPYAADHAALRSMAQRPPMRACG